MQNFNYAGVIDYAEAVCDTQGILRRACNPAPMPLYHGDADRNLTYGTIGVDGVWMFGSKSIADDLARRKMPHGSAPSPRPTIRWRGGRWARTAA
ncbi:hypothetical protein [Alistipes sp.]|uniref:hypothetical protein n=1 Tax=Alistipes sp. TaxID=1872444 RepID=UPI0025BEB867|nr:hypothetical protein [Alistipes sp.]